MSNDEDASTVVHQPEVKNGDNDYYASPSSPSRLTDFEIKECKKEPDSGWASDDLSDFGSSSTSRRTVHIPESALTIKSPIILLERCDKIWETLKLIRVQSQGTNKCASPTMENEDEEENKEEKQDDQEVGLWNMTFPIKTKRRITYEGKTPFEFSVQKTRKLYPCVICGKQYLEKRSLRTHALRLHGIIIPVRHKRKSRVAMQNTSASEENSDKVHNNKYSHGKTTAGRSEATKVPSSNLIHSKSRSQNAPDSNNGQSKNNTEPLTPPKSQYNKCVLCRQEVKCLKKHLINYHKIGCSANMLKQLESSLTIGSGSSSGSSSKPTLKDILSGKPPEVSVNRGTQNKSHTPSTEDKTRKTSVVTPQKRKYTLSYVNAKKRFKLNNGRYVPVQKASSIVQKHTPVKHKCNICLGIYASVNSLAKHKRIHISRGETKENFHKFVCKYFNSPLSKRYQQRAGLSSAQSADTNVKSNKNNSNGNLRSSNSKVPPNQHQRTGAAVSHDAKKDDITCVCGRSFRNHCILRAHKDNCKLWKQEEKEAQHSAREEYSSDRDSGIGINITIKKRNNSYEIVGKDGEEDKQTDDVATPSLDNAAKDAVNANTGRKRPGESNVSPKYSRNHSVLKLEDADEDLMMDIEEDACLPSEQRRKRAVQRNDESRSRTRPSDDAANVNNEENLTPENARTLKQMCQEVLKKLASLQETTTGNASKQSEKKKDSRSVNTSHETTEKEHAKSRISPMNFDPTTCAYCDKQFGTVALYNKHQCLVEEGKRFDEYSLNLRCFSCNATTLSSCGQFDEHMKNKHHARGAYYCYLCPRKFWIKKARNKHANTQHDTSCKFCHMHIPLWIINLHESYHLGYGYPCHKCKKAYSTKKNLSYHNTTIHKNDVMTFCNLCLKSVKVKDFRFHMLSHEGKKCHFCEKEFNDKAAVEYHTMVYHGGAFSKLRCSDCGMRYLTKQQLEQHKNTAGCDRIKKVKQENML